MYKNKSQQTLFPTEAAEDEFSIKIPQTVAREAGVPKPVVHSVPPPLVDDSGRDWWLRRANGDDRACVSATGFCADTCEKLWDTYGRNTYIFEREVLWAVLYVNKTGALSGTWQTLFKELGCRTTVKQCIDRKSVV